MLMAGCATTAPKLSELQKIPSEREFAYQIPQPGTASITILRDKAFAGSAVAYKLLVDGTLSAQIRSGEFILLYIPMGERVIEVRHPSARLGAIGDSATVRANSGERYYYRINSDLGQIRLLRTTEESINPK